MEILGRGVIHYVTLEYAIASKGHQLYKRDYKENNWQRWCSLPVSYTKKLVSSNRWFARLSREEVYHLIKVKEGLFGCFAFGKIFLIKEKTGDVEVIGDINGSRPLKICADGKSLYYGSYTGNKERKPIGLYKYSIEDENWSVHCSFKNVRHIHGAFWDHYTSKLWVTTGDLDHESTVWRFNDSGIPEKIVTGSQQTRAVDLLFTPKAVFYATDAPHDPNYICRLDRETGKTEKLSKVGGPVFYGSKTGNWLFFSTVVEPSGVNRTDAVELWSSSDNGNTWRKLMEIQKDIGHMKLFQYGQIKFPNGPGDGKNLWLSPYATEHDHRIVKIPLSAL